MTEFYDKPLDYAKEHGEMDKWRESYHETVQCAKSIEKLIAEYHDGYHLATDKIIEGAVNEFGTERVTLAIAATIRQKEWDGRFSLSNKEWAKNVDVPQDNHYNCIYINAHSTLLDGVVSDYRKFLLTYEKNLAEKQDISNKIKTEKSGKIQGGTTTMAEHNTTFEVSSMTTINDVGNVKALANIVINKEIAINGLKVIEGENGLFVSMPSKKVGGDFADIAHPITDVAREQLNNAVLANYEKLVSSGERTLKNDLETDKSAPVKSDINVSVHAVNGTKSVVAAGQINIDDCFVIKDVKVIKPEGKPEFLSMPSYQNQNGKYVEIANPITTAMYNKIQKEGISKYNSLEKVEYKGVRYAELGDKDKGEIAATSHLNNKFAEKLMGELDKVGVTYQARVGSNSGTVVSVNIADKQKLDTIQKELVKALNPEKEKSESAPAQDKPKHTKH